MAKFNKRVFGDNVSKDVILEFKKLAGGFKTAFGESGEEARAARDVFEGVGGILEPQEPTFEKYLGDRTPFSRMWCAVNITAVNKDTLKVDKETSKIRVFTVNENKKESYVHGRLDNINPLEPKVKTTSKKLDSVSQLQKNPLLKPEAGITSVTSKTQGALGAIQNTTVEFVVHNHFDFENIFLPFFLKPGSIVCVDYGWSDKSFNLYDPMDKLNNNDTEMSQFDSDIYGEDGFLETNYGKVNTVMGNVVSYDSSITPEGSYNCSLEIVSRNTGLLDKEISDDNNLRFVFNNAFDDILIAAIASSEGADVEVSIQELAERSNDFIDLDVKSVQAAYLENSNIGYDGSDGGYISAKASRLGIFYSLYTTFVKNAQNNNGEGNEAYISLGKFEDLFLNSFVTGLIKKEKINEGGDLTEKTFTKTAKNNFENQYDSRNSYVRWHEQLYKIQTAEILNGEELLSFILPNNWTNSYNTIKTNRQKGEIVIEDSGAFMSKEAQKMMLENYSKKEGKDLVDAEKEGKHPSYPGIPVMPIRDLFISVAVINNAFKTKPTINDALLSICDKINSDSNKIWNIKLISQNESKANISFIDANLLPKLEDPGDMLTFDVTGETSIVSQCDLKFTTPKAGLSSMIAIGNISEPTNFDQLELSALNNFNILNRPDGDINHLVRSLPIQGEINPKIFDNTIGIDFDKIESKINETNINDGESTVANSDQDRFAEYMKEVAEKEDEYLNNLADGQKEEHKRLKDFRKKARKFNSDEYIFAKSNRDGIRKQLRQELYNNTSDTSVSPILPIELDLSLYGNNLLQIGDFYNINYLPSYYKNRVFFQIVGIEDKVDVSGWTTSYTSVMRINPAFNKFHNGKLKKVVIDPEFHMKELTKNIVAKGVFTSNKLAQKAYSDRITLLEQSREYISRPSGGDGMGFTFDIYSSWFKPKPMKDLSENVTGPISFHPYIVEPRTLKNPNNFAYMYAVRNAILLNINSPDLKIVVDEQDGNKEHWNKVKSDSKTDIFIAYQDYWKILDFYDKDATNYGGFVALLDQEIFSVDERELALSKVLQDIIPPIDTIESKAYGKGAFRSIKMKDQNSKTEEVVKLPMMIKQIQFRDENLAQEKKTVKKDGKDVEEEIPDSGNEIVNIVLKSTGITGWSDPTINTHLKIPRWLIKKSGTWEEQICDEITKNYIEYIPKITEVLNAEYSRSLAPDGQKKKED